MRKHKFWEKPALHYEEEREEHRKVTWLELFFDLFFVVTIAQLTHALAVNPSWQGVVQFVALFIPIFWVWIGFTYYNERFESQGLENRAYTFALMLAVVGLATFADNGLDEGFRGFVLSYAVARAIITALWLRPTIYLPEFRPTGVRLIASFGLSGVATVVAAFADEPLRYILFGIALAVELLAPLTVIKLQDKLPRFSTSKLPERFGLFVIIVLGEMVVGIVDGLADIERVRQHVFIDAMLGVILGLAMWSIYFDFIGRRAPRKGGRWVFLWAYSHLPLLMAIAATGAGVANVIGTGALSPEVRHLIATGVASALIVMALLETTLRPTAGEPARSRLSPTLKMLGGLLALAIGWFGSLTDPVTLIVALIGVLLVQAIYGAWTWFSQDLAQS